MGLASRDKSRYSGSKKYSCKLARRIARSKRSRYTRMLELQTASWWERLSKQGRRGVLRAEEQARRAAERARQ